MGPCPGLTKLRRKQFVSVKYNRSLHREQPLDPGARRVPFVPWNKQVRLGAMRPGFIFF